MFYLFRYLSVYLLTRIIEDDNIKRITLCFSWWSTLPKDLDILSIADIVYLKPAIISSKEVLMINSHPLIVEGKFIDVPKGLFCVKWMFLIFMLCSVSKPNSRNIVTKCRVDNRILEKICICNWICNCKLPNFYWISQ